MMDDRSIRSVLARRRRGKILELLRACEPHAIPDVRDLYRLLQNTGEVLTIDDLIGLLKDLKQRNCVKFDSRYRDRQDLPEITLIRLDSRGRDVLEGSTEDPGIDAR